MENLTPNLQKALDRINGMPSTCESECKSYYNNHLKTETWVRGHALAPLSSHPKVLAASTFQDKIAVILLGTSSANKRKTDKYIFITHMKKVVSALENLDYQIGVSKKKVEVSRESIKSAKKVIKNLDIKSNKYDLDELKRKMAKKITNLNNLYEILDTMQSSLRKYKMSIKIAGQSFIGPA